MNQITETTRQFRVHARDAVAHPVRVLEETTFEAAAVAYLEDFPLRTSAGDDHEVSIIVHDLGTGHEHCFKVDILSGETVPCG
jgi:hypothetical protein